MCITGLFSANNLLCNSLNSRITVYTGRQYHPFAFFPEQASLTSVGNKDVMYFVPAEKRSIIMQNQNQQNQNNQNQNQNQNQQKNQQNQNQNQQNQQNQNNNQNR